MADTTLPKALETLAVSKTKELKGTEKRDALIEIEKKYQKKWEEDHVFEVDAPSIEEFPLDSITPDELREKFPKFFGTIAYPYMNGRLHAGHAFSFSKIEFNAGYARMQGKRALFPQGYHCTGLPIKASADKLVKEVEMFGQNFERYKEEEEVVEAAPAPAKGPKEDLSKFNAKKGKAAAKTVKAKYQFQILNSVGVPIEEIHKFSDPQYWLQFFPPACKKDLTNFGARIDWRRQFVTTDANPYYDAFVRWQMNRLKELDKVKFGKRYTVYSIKDGQPCMDHDRSEGEGVLPQEYTALKLKVVEWAPKAAEALKGKIPEGASVYLVPATLRPETMYGQTCCFVGPALKYGVFKASEKEYFVITERAAKNMAFQGIFEKDFTIPDKAADIVGSDMIGTLVDAPLSFHGQVRVLPMDTVLATKGTGVVTSVPSDSPDDFAMVTELAKKADFYGIKKEWAELEIVPIIQTPTSDLLAPYLVKKLKIASPKDAKQLLEAKELAYKEGFYQGVMKVGDFAGEKVEIAKPKVREQLLKAGQAFAYSEPENKVVSRSGDECTVALLDQWYIDYGEDSWRALAFDYVENKDGKGLNTYSPDTQHAFKGVLNWLRQWACARTYGLGSKLPWDHNFLVESLSDSTVYMAYYTLVPWLHTDNFGKEKGKGNIAAEQMTDEVWDYVFARTQLTDKLVQDSGIPKETLQGMRRDFEYFYPLDLRVSGKDLIPNHLTFWLYNHIALFSREYWPKSVRANGHLQLNGEKMSKSTGNFMTLDDVVKKYGADAARVALADAGDGISDSNFVEDVADNTILRFHTNKEWIEETIKDQNLRTGELNDFQDAIFDNEMNALVAETKKHYDETSYKLALKAGHYDFLNARDTYREACTAAGIPLHKDLVLKYIRLQALILTPIAPHWAEYIWQEVLGEKTSIQFALWPEVPAAIPALSAARDYVRTTSSNINSAEAAQLKKMAKGRQSDFDPKKPKKLTVFMTESFPAWQAKYIELLKEVWDVEANKSKVDDKELNGRIGKMGEMKKAMPFVQALKKRLASGEPANAVLERKLAFDEKKTLLAMVPGLKRAAGLESIQILAVEEGNKAAKDLTNGDAEVEITNPVAEAALPGQPSFFFTNV
ncbi:putative leucyl-tRNA synthetase, cytoplasmic [Cladorrhinum samala]|uniref:leucine--tRNA ligase n=1 Tax=Cladorrhinum samala TaxID=585594 RepID=A0AAV9HWE7_9PEZI|nr:putative leucyl-tRNA synthetase, cytoplasmic [Cladorrhinum samala]